MPAGQQLQELGMRLRCDDSGSEHVSDFQAFFFLRINSVDIMIVISKQYLYQQIIQ